jgi:hypothetical protein
MDWRQIPLADAVVEAASIVGEAEVVLQFTETARGWFRVTVFEDLRSSTEEARFFARAVERDDPLVQAMAAGDTPEEAATICLREAGVSLRRARGR